MSPHGAARCTARADLPHRPVRCVTCVRYNSSIEHAIEIDPSSALAFFSSYRIEQTNESGRRGLAGCRPTLARLSRLSRLSWCEEMQVRWIQDWIAMTVTGAACRHSRDWYPDACPFARARAHGPWTCGNMLGMCAWAMGRCHMRALQHVTCSAHSVCCHASANGFRPLMMGVGAIAGAGGAHTPSHVVG